MTKIIEGKDLANMQFIETEDGLLKRYEKKGRFVPKINQVYWFIKENGCISGYTNDHHEIDNWILKHNPVFETEEECEEYRDYLIALDKYSHDFTQEEWGNYNINKFALCFDFDTKNIGVFIWSSRKFNMVFFETEENANAFINEVGEETIEKFMFGYYR